MHTVVWADYHLSVLHSQSKQTHNTQEKQQLNKTTISVDCLTKSALKNNQLLWLNPKYAVNSKPAVIQTSLSIWPPVLWSPSASKRSKVAVAPSGIGRNLRTPRGVGVLTRPILPYRVVWRWPLFPHNKGGMYLNRRFSPYLINSCNHHPKGDLAQFKQ